MTKADWQRDNGRYYESEGNTVWEAARVERSGRPQVRNVRYGSILISCCRPKHQPCCWASYSQFIFGPLQNIAFFLIMYRFSRPFQPSCLTRQPPVGSCVPLHLCGIQDSHLNPHTKKIHPHGGRGGHWTQTAVS